MTDLGNPYQALGKETVRTSYEQSHKETCLKFGSSVKCIDRKKYFYYDKNKADIIYLCSDQTQ